MRFGGLTFGWNFAVADVTQPILGMDFLCAHSLMVDVGGQRLVDIESFETIRVIPDYSEVPRVNFVANGSERF